MAPLVSALGRAVGMFRHITNRRVKDEYFDLEMETLYTPARDLAWLDALPDEVLLRILAFVRDARVLLDVVPRVCARWHRLHREPCVWESIDLLWVDDADAARLLLRAPALRTLRVDVDVDQYGEPAGEARRRMASALRRARLATLECLVVTRMAWGLLPAAAGRAVVELLRRHAATLRDVDMFVPPDASRALRALCGVPSLQRLRLHLGENGIEYKGELAGWRLPALAELRVFAERSCCGEKEPEVPDELLADLARAAASSLRTLGLHMNHELVLAPLRSLQRLEWLTLYLHLDAEDAHHQHGNEVQAAVVGAVDVAVDAAENGVVDDDDDDLPPVREEVSELTLALRQCEGLAPTLRQLEVSLHRGFRYAFDDDLHGECSEVVRSFALLCPDVEVDFYLNGRRMPNTHWDLDSDLE